MKRVGKGLSTNRSNIQEDKTILMADTEKRRLSRSG